MHQLSPSTSISFFAGAAICIALSGCFHVEAPAISEDSENCAACSQQLSNSGTDCDSDSSFDNDNNNDSNITDSESTPTTPLINYCLSLDGDGDYMRVFSHDALSIEGNWTIEAWVRYYENDSIVQPILRMGEGTTSIGAYFLYAEYQYGVPMGGYGYNSGSYRSTSGIEKLPTEQWIHLAYTHTSGLQQLFIDGELINEEYFTDDAYFINDDLLFGAMPHPSLTGYLEGDIDDVRISSTVRYTDNFVPPTNYVVDDDTVVQWTFQDGDMPTIQDDTHSVVCQLEGDAEIVER